LDIYKTAKKYRTSLSGFFGVLYLIVSQPTFKSLKYGTLLIIIGQAIRLWSSGHIYKSQVLTVTGPYSLSRNPLYVGSFVLGTGFIIAMGVIWLGVVFLFFFAAVYWFTIRWEEQKLAREFPDEWEVYKRTVPRFLSFSNLSNYHPGEFSWIQVRKHKEILNALVVVAAYAFLWGKALLIG
jgi:protein-S-isoprenylcysteine O-methyltransferase Ste14